MSGNKRPWNFVDLTGKRFERLVPLWFNDENKKWHCKCDCGNECEVRADRLNSGRIKSCGCLRKEEHGNTTRLLGKKPFGRLSVVSFSHFDKNRKDYWNCICSCGNKTIVQGYNLTSGAVTSCGCINKERTKTEWFNDLTGHTYGELTVVEFVGRKNLHSMWKCKCSCGKEVVVTANNLRRGHTTSCGHSVVHVCGSKEEKEIKEFICSIIGDKNIEKAKILNGKEIDIYIPQLKIGIEYNGSPFHATINGAFKNVNKTYHYDKFSVALSMGIKLLNIFDVDWKSEKQEKIKTYIRSLLIQKERVFARNCSVRLVDLQVAKMFIEKHHLQGWYRLCKINYGLYYNNELISLMSFGTPRFAKSGGNQYELHRYVVSDKYFIVGGAEKLLKHFINDHQPESIKSYSDNDFFSGDVYKKLGFSNCGVSENYYWFYNNRELKRTSCQLHLLKELYGDLYAEAVTENANNKEDFIMGRLGAKKVYRAGNTKWIMNLNTEA
jgi:hypothetical protein|uniref:Endonuclease-like protein n=1 Tax=Myoviridae sp. ctqfO1 TaxID=2827710 RepID=A0A8S5T2D7_9CAUD|nr:MAG TPA: endonuclease-like protein [Myoviridae sp. ctqfO1]